MCYNRCSREHFLKSQDGRPSQPANHPKYAIYIELERLIRCLCRHAAHMLVEHLLANLVMRWRSIVGRRTFDGRRTADDSY